MKNMFYFFNCCKKTNYQDEVVNTNTSQIETKDTIKSQKKEKKNPINPFLNPSAISTKYNNISPRFVGNGIILNDNENISNKLSKKETYKKVNSLISFSNFPLQIVQIDKNEKNKIIGPKLLLTGELFYNNELVININGMTDGLRQKNDSVTYFGTKIINDYKGIPYIDYLINYQLSGEKEQNDDSLTGRIFNITYQKRTKDFYLHVIHDSAIIYYEINNIVYFDDEKNYFLLIGNTFVTIITKLIGNKKGIEIEIENSNNDYYSFTEEEAPISIGRINCKVIIGKESVSKYHSVIEFSKESQKFYYKDLGSTNGSVLLVKEDDNLLVQGEMNLKLDNVPFRILNLP